MTALDQALQHFQAGRPREAEQVCRDALARDPANAAALHLLGVLAHQAGHTAEAVELLGRAVSLSPANAEFLYNLGVAQQVLGRLDDAIASYQESLRLQPDRAEAHNNLGYALLQRGRRDEAEASFHQALHLKPDLAGAHTNLGRVCEDRGRLPEAAARFRLALCYDPDNASFLTNLANVLTVQGEAREALPLYRQAVRLQPAEPTFHNNLANALTLLGKPDEAEGCCRQALRLRPEYADAFHNLAITQAAQGDVGQALVHNADALRLQPEHPGARNCRALWWLQQGDFERGWPEYEWRWKVRGVSRRTFPQPPWDGALLAGRTILLYAEQALGDTIQFIRYAVLVKERGGTVVVECQPPLARLLSGCPGIDRLIARGSPLPEFDVQAPLLSLPGLFRTTLATVLAEVPYIVPEPGLVERWRGELGGDRSFKIGIAWQGSTTFPGDRLRSLPLRHFAPLADVGGVRLISLQKGAAREQIKDVARHFAVTDLGERLDENGAFTDTAAVMKSLDLVVTSDTAIAHLAGALGVPVWVALSVGPDWRWLLGREDCPWYPTMRLFRQTGLHDWDGVFERMAAELRRKLGPAARRAVAVEIAPGELIDKLTILEIKAERVTDAAKQHHVREELAALRAARDRDVPPGPELSALTAELRAVNEALWQIEDEIRCCERDQDFGPRFIELARSVYRTNDRRSALKRQINDLLGSALVEEKEYIDYGAAGAPTAAPRATVCILTYGDHLSYFRRCLDSVLRHTPPEQVELRLGFNAAPASFDYARECLPLAGTAAESEWLPGDVLRTSFVSRGGTTVRLWNSPVNLYKEPIARLMYHDVALATEYAVWLDDDSFVEAGWWQALSPLFDGRVDYIGQPWWVDYLPGQAEMIRAQPWFRGVPFESRGGRPGVQFMTGGFLAVRAERLREANFPDTDSPWKGDTLKQYGGDTLLGEIARQLGWTQAAHGAHVKVNVDLHGRHPAPRRGGTGRQFGSDIDVAIS